MPIVTTNFIAGRMNKSVDERLLPPGEYIDAMNVRLGSTESTEIGAVENSKGNEQLTTIQYNGVALSPAAVCIGAYEDGVRETIYWFIHDGSNTQNPKGVVDLVVSYNTTNEIVNYHVVTVDLLNFDPKFLITGVDLIEDLLFWTDDKNPPRTININRSYPEPISNVDQIIEEDISVIVKPPGFENIVGTNIPLPAPKLNFLNIAGNQNYIENRFLCFAYRYRYEDGQYSATSLFTNPGFVPRPFKFSTKNYCNDGMLNLYNGIEIKFSTGSSRVKEVDLLFKDTNSTTLNVIERFKKEDYGWANNTTKSFTFTNNKIYTVLGNDELLRQYDNVPRLAKAQTIQGNRLMYGNYVDGYNITRPDADGNNIAINYNTSLVNTIVGFAELPLGLLNNGLTYTLDPNPGQSEIIPNSKVTIDFSSIADKLKANSLIGLTFNFDSDKRVFFPTGTAAATANINFENQPFTLSVNITLDQDYASPYDFFNSPLFAERIGTILGTNFKPIATADQGNSLTDFFNNELSSPAIGTYPFVKYNSSISDATNQQGFRLSNFSPGSNTCDIQTIAMAFQSIDLTNPSSPITTTLYEYFRFISVESAFTTDLDTGSLHSDRDYETGIVYSDEYGRSSTVLVSEYNTVYVEPGNSVTANSIQVAISSRAPYWAERYKFVVKPSKAGYETIFCNFYYVRPSDNMVFFRLEGDNANKVQKGQTLAVKADVSGPLSRVETCEILEISAEPTNFLDDDNEFGDGSFQLKGLYMQIKNQNFDIVIPDDSLIEFGNVRKTSSARGCTNGRKIGYKCFTTNPDTNVTTNYEVPGGSVIRIKVTAFRNDTFNGNSCQEIKWEWEQEYIASRDYTDMRRWWLGDNINPSLGQPGNLQSETTIINNTTLATPNGTGNGVANNMACTTWDITFQWIQDNAQGINDPLYLGVSSGIKGCNRPWPQSDRTSDLDVELIVFRANTLMVFETEPNDANAELYYDASQSFPISQPDGFHMSGVNSDLGDQNQTATQDAIVNLDFRDCFSFGNGVESFKIKDQLGGRPFQLGQRTLAVSNQDFKEADRFEGLTYSGIFSSNSGVNNLNEFNLGLVNFKDCETSFGPIQKMHPRETDILVLQEDRITYVLSSKNLISDSTGGGVIASVPQILGTQIARIEEYGISYNPESFVSHGSDMFFTDVKRSAVIKLRGTSRDTDSLEVISDMGMRSWFRDEFHKSIQTQKLGGYDPYMDEYVLGMNCNEVPLPPEIFQCGYKLQRNNLAVGASNAIVSEINYGALIGSAGFNYNITAGSITISVLWNSITTTSSTLTGSGTFTFNKTLNSPANAVVTITAVSTASFVVTANCVDSESITVVKVVMNSPSENGEFIHAEYFWEDSINISPVDSDLAELGNTNLTASYYDAQSGIRSLGVFPYNGVDLTIRSNKINFDTYDWNYPNDNFKYLSSNTLYSNNQADIASLLAAATTVPNSSVTNPSAGLYETTISSLSLPTANQYLYLIYDYRLVSCQEFCYDASSAASACCECAFTYTAYPSSTVFNVEANVCNQPLNATYYHSGSGTLPAYGDFVYYASDGAVGSNLAVGLYKVSATDYITVNQFGLVTAVTTCP